MRALLTSRPGAGGQPVEPGYIIVRQRGTKMRGGEGVGVGRDHTLWALESGIVRYQWNNLHKQQTVSVIPHAKFAEVSTHKALECSAHNDMNRALRSPPPRPPLPLHRRATASPPRPWHVSSLLPY